MQGTTIRIKVPVDELIGLVKDAKAKHLAEVAKAQQKFEDEFGAWRKRVEKYLRDVTPANVDKLGWPSRPYPPRERTTDFDRDLALLKRTSDTELTITASSNFLRYIVAAS